MVRVEIHFLGAKQYKAPDILNIDVKDRNGNLLNTGSIINIYEKDGYKWKSSVTIMRFYGWILEDGTIGVHAVVSEDLIETCGYSPHVSLVELVF